MSEGPIKREREAWKPPKASSTDAERVCYVPNIAQPGYCGRRPRLGHIAAETIDVTCSDCIAALMADGVIE